MRHVTVQNFLTLLFNENLTGAVLGPLTLISHWFPSKSSFHGLMLAGLKQTSKADTSFPKTFIPVCDAPSFASALIDLSATLKSVATSISHHWAAQTYQGAQRQYCGPHRDTEVQGQPWGPRSGAAGPQRVDQSQSPSAASAWPCV